MAGAKTILLTHEFSPFRGGAAIYAEEVARASVELGHEIEMWAPDYGKHTADNEYSFPVVRLRSGGSLHFFHMLEYTRALRARIHLLRAATIVPVSVGAHMALMILTRSKGARLGEVISVLHGSEVLRFNSNPICRRLARKFFRNRVERIATVSEFSRSLIRQSRIVPNEIQILIAPGACSTAAKEKAGAILRRDGVVKILTLARIDPRKGQLDVAQALARLPPETRTKILYQAAGRGDTAYLREIETVCRRGQVPFVFLGEIKPERLSATYSQCDIYAMTSRQRPRSVEGLGITYLEAGYHGKPVVAYDSGGAPEAVIDRETGLLVPEGDISALATAFAQLIASPELRARLGKGGRRHAARYDWQTTARILLQCNSP